jgi:Uma2 family endonuclease
LETSIRIGRHQVPRADIVVSDYQGPPAILPVSSVALVVEVADTTATYDRTEKAHVYAMGGIPEYWVLDIQAGEIVRFARPGRERYATEAPVKIGAVVEALTIPELAVDTAGIRIKA